MRRKFYNREENKPKTTVATGPHLPRDKFDFFEKEAKDVSASKKRPRRDSGTDHESEQEKAGKKAKTSAKPTKISLIPKTDAEGATTKAPLVEPPLQIVPANGEEVEITHEETSTLNPLGDIIFADPNLLSDYDDNIKQAVFTQVHNLATHLHNGGDCKDFSGWKCEHGVNPTNVQMKVEDKTLKSCIPYISLFVPQDMPAVQRLLQTEEDPMPVLPPDLLCDTEHRNDDAQEVATAEEEEGDEENGNNDAEVESEEDSKGDAEVEEDAAEENDNEDTNDDED